MQNSLDPRDVGVARVRCRHCLQPLRIPQDYLGRSVRCPLCKEVFTAQSIRREEHRSDLVEEFALDQEADPTQDNATDQDRKASSSGIVRILMIALIGLVIVSLIVGAVLIPRLVNTSIPERQWAEFTTPDGKLVVLLPGKPEVKKQPIVGSTDLAEMYAVELPFASYLVGSLDVPQKDSKTVSPEERLSSIEASWLEKMKGKLVMERAMRYQQRPAREIVVNIGDQGRLIARLIADGNRIYLLMAGGRNCSVEDPDVLRFFDSVRFTTK